MYFSPKLFLLIISFFIVSVISGCGSDQSTQDSSSSFNLPTAITQAKIADKASIQAYLQVDSGTRQQMTLSGSSASIEIAGLSPGPHQFTITIEYSDGTNSGQPLILAQTSHTADISAGANTPLEFVDSDYNFQAFDSDRDGISNLDEVLTNNADLHSIALSTGSLNETFDPAETDYTASVAYEVTSIQVSAILQNSAASLSINGVSTANDTESAVIDLVQGSNEITVSTTSEDGTLTKDYVLTITRQDPADNNANLQDLQLSAGSLDTSFQSETTSYTASVDYSVTKIQVSASPVNSSATLKINSVSTPNDTLSSEIALSVGSNPITVKVTSGDQSTSQDYSITITRAGPPADDATLQSLQLSSGSFNQSFAPDVASYSANVAYETASIRVTANPLNSNATLKINDIETTNDTASNDIELVEGSNTIKVKVTSADGTSNKVYTLEITRLGVETSLATADLQSISLSSASLSPTFQPDNISYSSTVSNETTEILVTANPLNSNATLEINHVAISSNPASTTIALSEGNNTITIKVTSEDESTEKTYELVVSRAYSITATAGSHGAISPGSATVNQGGSTSFTVTPDTGYSIDNVTGCGGSLTGNTFTTATITAACTVNASFKINSYTVNTSAGANGSISPGSKAVDYGNTTSFTVTPNTGYSIDSVTGCSGSLTGNTYTTGAITAPCSVNASFKINSYTVSTSAGATGSISPGSKAVDYGNTTSFTVTPNTGYSIDSVTGCNGSLTGNTYTTGTITASCTVSATFKINSYTVTTSAGSNGNVNTDSAMVNHGGSTSFIFTPNTGYSIDTVTGCSGSLTGNTYTTGAITAPCTVSVKFKINSYTVSTSAGTTGSISPGSKAVDYGNTTSFTVTPNTGYSIDSVTGCSGSLTGNTYTTGAITAPCTVAASFKISAKNANLQSLELSAGSLAFDPETTAYTVNVAYSVSSIQVTANPLNSSATLTVNGSSTANNSPSASIALVEGANTFSVTVTSADGTTTKDYVLTINRLSPTNDIANLSALSLSSGDMDQIFQSTQPYYTASVDWLVSSLQVSATTKYGSANVSINGGASAASLVGQKVELAEGENIIELIVTAADGVTQRRYTVTVTRASIQSFAQRAYVKASNTEASDGFGWSVAQDGDTLVLGAPNEDSASSEVNGDQMNNLATNAGAVYVFTRSNGEWSQQAYLKASNAEGGDNFGFSVALLGDTIAVGAKYEDSAANVVNGDQLDNAASNAGAVYVFTRSNGEWSQQAYLKASNAETGDSFGASVSLSGNTLVVGADYEGSAAHVVNGDQSDNSALGAGAVYVFTRSNAVWSQQAYLKASNADEYDHFGYSVSISDETLAVGAFYEDSGSDQIDNTAAKAGAVYVFTRSNGLWNQQAYLKASNAEAYDNFGSRVALLGDTLAVGASGESSASSEVNGDQSDNTAANAGAVYIFIRSNGMWNQQAYLKASNAESGDFFGASVSLADDMLAVGAFYEDSEATVVNGNQLDNTTADAGAVYVFTRSKGEWSQLAYVKASNSEVNDYFGRSVSLSRDTLAAWALGEDSVATGVNGDQLDNSVSNAGAVYVFR